MCSFGFNVGGEQLGYMVFFDFGIIGDGFVVVFQVLVCVKCIGKMVSEVCCCFELVLQLLKNVCYFGGLLLENKIVKEVIVVVEFDLKKNG